MIGDKETDLMVSIQCIKNTRAFKYLGITLDRIGCQELNTFRMKNLEREWMYTTIMNSINTSDFCGIVM